MRILLVADIHGNWPALRAIEEPHDVCLCLGDLVDYGLEPAPCIDWVRRNATHAVRGNHDHGAAQNVIVTGRNGYKHLTGLTRPPVSKTVTIEDTRFLLVHATPRDPLDEYAPPDGDFWARRLENVDADV